MSAKSLGVQLERIARKLISIAKQLDCSLDVHVVKYHDGRFGGDVFKIDRSATNFSFEDGQRINFSGLASDKRHLYD